MDHELKLFEGDYNGFDKHYLERGESSSTDDETVIARPYKFTGGGYDFGEIVITHDSGKKWEKPDALKGKKIGFVAPHPFVKDMVFFILSDWSTERSAKMMKGKIKKTPKVPASTRACYTLTILLLFMP